MRRTVATLLAAAAMPLFTPPVSAWGGDGHRIVCEIAWLRLEPHARQFVRRLLHGEPRPIFNAVCSWADDVRDTTHRHTEPYHHVNVPAGAAGFNMARDCGDQQRRCTVWAIEHYARVLADGSASQRERAEALKFVAHFVADLHQPLHVGRPGDRGGNDVPVRFFGDPGPPDRPYNLHRVWDVEILRRAGSPWRSTAQRLHRRISPQDAAAWARLDPAAWATESFLVANRFAYPELPLDRSIGPGYYARALEHVEARLQRAGVRLAHLLNAAGKAPR